jgi:hypothetical protein
MKAISLWQPWATLIVIGAKKYETRSWSPDHFGRVAIHAAKHQAQEIIELCKQEPFRSVLATVGIKSFADLPLGAYVGECSIVRAHRTEKMSVSDQERAFGDYGRGRWAWELEKPIPYPQPIPGRGQQGFWEWVWGCDPAMAAVTPASLFPDTQGRIALRITAESVQRAADGTEFVMLKVEGVHGPVRVEKVKEEHA